MRAAAMMMEVEELLCSSSECHQSAICVRRTKSCWTLCVQGHLSLSEKTFKKYKRWWFPYRLWWTVKTATDFNVLAEWWIIYIHDFTWVKNPLICSKVRTTSSFMEADQCVCVCVCVCVTLLTNDWKIIVQPAEETVCLTDVFVNSGDLAPTNKLNLAAQHEAPNSL